MPPKSRQVESNSKVDRIPSPSKSVASYRVLGGLNQDLLLYINELSDSETKNLICNILDQLQTINAAITTSNLPTLLKSLEGIKKYNVE